ncbi:MAG TPA: phosphatidylglycerol lysyltransferase domain-containing protein [Candidatus Saccharimonadales bacterium]|nr:phosphatidylglycerol lysyltransferase domain-containing protein [Candidatus Saccharimonadales bacterium]
MQRPNTVLRQGRLIAWVIVVYGLVLIGNALLRELTELDRRSLNELIFTLPVAIGISYTYLGTLLLRLKYNAWLVALTLSAFTAVFNTVTVVDRHFGGAPPHPIENGLRIGLPVVIATLLVVSRSVFRVRSDYLGFKQAARTSLLVLAIAFVYGIAGFTLLDTRDFHQEISVPTAIHQTVDQFGATTVSVTPYTRRARMFVDSLSVVSVGAVGYVLLAFFQPIRFRFQPERGHRELAEELLRRYPSDIDDFFKLWPQDKHYFFDSSHESGLAYRVSQGVALVVGDPFGNPKRFLLLIQAFQDLCFVNDWRPGFVHTTPRHKDLYLKLGYHVQKLGEEAVLNLEAFRAHRDDKYFRQIRNRFSKLGYSVELLDPPHGSKRLARLRAISTTWLTRPGRAERGFMLGYHSNAYMQLSRVAVARDAKQRIRGFINIVPTYEAGTANYDLLRCDVDAPGNCNDFLLMGLIDLLSEEGCHTLNLGLCLLAGMDEPSETVSIIDTAMRLAYANGDRFFSFSGLQRFKAKYEPEWEDRYVASGGSLANFARVMTALNSAMKIK